MKRLFAFAALGVVALLGGCATTALMPSSGDETVDEVTWKSYSEAEGFFQKVEVGKSTVGDLAELGLNLKMSKNVSIMKETDLSALFLPNVLLAQVLNDPEYVGIAAKLCLKPGANCVPYVYSKDETKEDSKGSLVLRWLNFKKESTVRWWNVEMLFLVYNSIVVYKQINGTPNGTERDKIERRPLGPLDGNVGGYIGIK